jgi:adenine phosphoribosyltransferase
MKNITLEDFAKSIRDVPDFPKPGILFKDITTALNKAEVLRFLVDTLYEQYKDKGITKVVGIESRGFIIGSILAYKLNAGFVLMRKPGKLPADTHEEEYELEYGTDKLEIHKDALNPEDIVLMHDDLLATGGSARAAINLIRKTGATNITADFLIELSFLNGRKRLNDVPVNALIQFD